MISGHTQLIAHLGVPTENFRAPMIYNPWFEHQGIDVRVVPMGCESADYPSFLPLLFRLRNICGALITMPHKLVTASLVDLPSKAVQICQACNAVKAAPDGQLVGDMFDGEGFIRAMLAKGRKAQGASVLMVGAGGVGSAIAASLAKAGIARLSLEDRNPDAASTLAARLSHHYPQIAISTDSANPADFDPADFDPTDFDIVINASPLGMRPDDPLPFDIGKISPACFVGDVVMADTETKLIVAARERGCSVQPGLDMLYAQIPAYLEFFGFPTATEAELRAYSEL